LFVIASGSPFSGLRYDNAMKSKAHQNFENMLRAVVSVPAASVKASIAAERTEREQAKSAGKPQERSRPIVSLALVSSSTLERS
jgi:hypothetical protein